MQKDTNKTKEKILNVATKLFAKNGFTNTSMNDIANQVKIEKASLYYFYKNKNDIFYAVLEKSWTKLVNDLEKIITSKNGGKIATLNKCLTRLIETMLLSGIKSGLTIVDINSLKSIHSCACESVFKQINQVKQTIFNLLKETKCKQPDLAQQIIMNAIHGYIIHAQHRKPSIKPTAYANYLSNLFI